MNKIVYTSLLVFTLATAGAQSITGGIKVGYNLTRLGVSGQLTDPVVNNDWVSSFHLGGFLRKSIGTKGALQVELLYSRKGARFERTNPGDDHLRLDYLNLPVLLNFRLAKKIMFEVGPEFGYLLGSERRVYSKFDLGLDAGLRYDLSRTISLGTRYSYGLASLTTFQFVTGSNVLRNQALQVSLAYNFF